MNSSASALSPSPGSAASAEGEAGAGGNETPRFQESCPMGFQALPEMAKAAQRGGESPSVSVGTAIWRTE